MPTILLVNGFKFFFYSNESNEPPHIHVTKGSGNAKYWLIPETAEDYSYGFTAKERKDIKELVIKNNSLFITKWNEYFAK